MRSSSAFLVAALLSVGIVQAQDGAPVRVELPPQESGAVFSLPLRVPAGTFGSTDTLAYEVTPTTTLRLFSPRTGRLLPRADGVVLLITGTLSRRQGAGTFRLATVRVTNAVGTAWEAEIVATVEARRRVDVSLRSEPNTIAPGGQTLLFLRLRNASNAPDTLSLNWDLSGGWQLKPSLRRVIIGPGEVIDTTLTLWADPTAQVGLTRVINVFVGGKVGALYGQTLVQVTPYGGIGQQHVRLPANVFAGAGVGLSGQVGMVGALVLTGEPLRDTQIQLRARVNPSAVWSQAFIEDVGGPRVELRVQRPTWRATAGTVGATEVGVLGGSLNGGGVSAHLEREGMQGDAFAAVTRGNALTPALYQGALQGVRATRYGWIGASSAVLYRAPDGFGEGFNLEAFSIRYLLPERPTHTLRVDAGLMHLATGEDRKVGPVLDAAYRYARKRNTLNGRLRYVPGALPTGEVLPSQLLLSGSTGLTQTVSLQGWGALSRLDLLGVPGFRNESVAAGPMWMQGKMRASVMGALQHAASTDPLKAATSRRSVAAVGGYRSGPFDFDLSGEVGQRIMGGMQSAVQVVRGSVRWSREREWFSFTASRNVGDAGQSLSFAHLNGALLWGATELHGGGAITLLGSYRYWNAWLSAARPLGPRMVVVAGIETDPGAVAPLRVSLGVRRRLSVPLPMAPPVVAEGRVFDDRNGNGRFDAGEPGVPNVGVMIEGVRLMTDADGHWDLRDGRLNPGTTAAVDPSSLPEGYYPAPGHREGHRFWSPLTHAASLTLRLYFDANNNGTRDSGEMSAPETIVSLADAQGLVRYPPVDGEGVARLTGLPGGTYTLVLKSTIEGRQTTRERTETLTLAAGESLDRSQPVPSNQRTIRVSNGN